MLNKKKVKKFTDCLYDLLVVQKVSLSGILDILEENRIKYLSRCAVEIKKELSAGNLFSSALFKNSFIRFDSTFILFMCFAEKTGNLEEFVSFLKKRCERREKNIQKIISVSAYPVFVLILLTIISSLILIYGETYFINLNIEKKNIHETLIKTGIFLFIFCVFIFFLLKKNIGENKLYEAFMAVNFLVKAGIDLGSAIGYGIIVNGPDTRYGKIFESARRRLEYGMDLRGAFNLSDKRKVLSGWQNELDEALFFAQKAGEKSDVFEKICKWFEVENDKRREICLSILEPLFTAVTGIILLVIMINFMMPVINNASLVL